MTAAKKQKLTPAQLSLLQSLSKGSRFVVDYYPPLKKLLELKLCEKTPGSRDSYQLSEEGKKVLEKAN